VYIKSVLGETAKLADSLWAKGDVWQEDSIFNVEVDQVSPGLIGGFQRPFKVTLIR
jgi:hypothetical protein